MAARLTLETVVTAIKDQAFSELGPEVVILKLSSGVYYGLDEVGTVIWKLVQAPKSLGAICEAIQAEYDVTHEQCQQDVLALAQRMIDEGLVEVSGEARR